MLKRDSAGTDVAGMDNNSLATLKKGNVCSQTLKKYNGPSTNDSFKSLSSIIKR